MSIKIVNEFYQKIASEEEMKTELSELFQPYEGKTLDEAERETLVEQILLPYAKQKGFLFTLEELKQYEIELTERKENGELSDEELEAVAGGLGIAIALCIIIGLGAGIHTGFCWITGLY